ncbi:MAG TPA: beta-ketoacyl synthase N-terminal-like domain-containing protein, partial [Longimicrobiaceae bacterium]|nr:beta-ketoacyl synthase N-terminal-like domain-containing protein [Longimicrobiaceae bacterium]
MNGSTGTHDHEALLRRAARELREMRLRLEALERERSEPVAVVGMGCRFPGGADSPEAFWELLREGRDAITEVPPERWDAAALYDPDLSLPYSVNTRWGGFVEGIDGFDPEFFGVPRREAAAMDPQQRLVLEVAWEALERAGIAPDGLAGSLTGVFVGICGWDYASLMAEPPARGGTGIAASIAANRVSYALDLAGPSMVVDTACSSSLVAVDLACQSLRSRGCDLALAGGVNAVLSPWWVVSLSQAGMMASDGRCKTFDERADGYVRGEGCGIVVLKRLSDALRDGDEVLATIRGSAVRQDGRSNGLTAPSGPAQEGLLREALRRAGVAPGEVGYVEAHGTGTALGDAIEAGPLRRVLSEGRAPDSPCRVGSVKTNIGHLEAAAGIAGLIKAVLALRHEEVPPHLHLQRLSPKVELGDTLRIPTAPAPWPRGERPRYAGVSSFGFGGTLAHVVLEEGPLPAEATPEEQDARGEHVLPLSARSGPALRELAGRWAAALGEGVP